MNRGQISSQRRVSEMEESESFAEEVEALTTSLAPEAKAECKKSKAGLVRHRVGGLRNTWKKCFARCSYSQPGRLFLYENPTAIKPSQEIDLSRAFIFAKTQPESFIIVVGTALTPLRMEERDRAGWLATLRDHGARIIRAVHEGYISLARSSGLFRWQNRFMVLFDNRVMVFKEESMALPILSLPLTMGAEVSVSGKDSKSSYSFTMAKTGDEGEKTYLLRCSIESERDGWLEMINKATLAQTRKVCPLSLREGYLFKTGKTDKKWHKRYCILLKEQLVYHRKRQDKEPAGQIDLPGGFVVEPCEAPGRVKRAHQFWVARNEDATGTRTYYFAAPTGHELLLWLTSLRELKRSKNPHVHPDSIQEGYLRKTASNLTTWSKRYFILLEDRFLYFRRKDDFKEGVDPAGEIEIPGGAEVQIDDEFSRPYSFYVARNGDATTRKYYMAARSSEERAFWIDTFATLLKQRNPNICATSIKEGYLWKCSSNLRSWTKRYFILWKDKLQYYKSKDGYGEGVKPQGEIPIVGGAECEIIYVENHDYAFYVARNGDETTRKYLLQAKSQEEREEWLSTMEKLLATKESKVHADSIKEGYLWRKGERKAWNKRYFVLNYNKFMFFKSKDDVKELKTEGELDIDGGNVVRMEAKDMHNKLPMVCWSFARNGDDDATKHIFGAKDAAIVQTWLETFHEVLATKPSQLHPYSLREGYLHVRSVNPKTRHESWNKRYFILTHEKFTYFRHRDDFKTGTVEDEVELNARVSLRRLKSASRSRVFHLQWRVVHSNVLLSAETEEQYSLWFEAVQSVLQLRRTYVHPASRREGYLDFCEYKLRGLEMGAPVTWTKRYFVLLNDKLTYFATKPGGYDPKAKPEGEFPLPSTAASCQRGNLGNKQSAFRYALGYKRDLWLSSNDEAELSQWFLMMQNATRGSSDRVHAHSIKEGYLLIGRRGRSTKTYCILLTDVLIYVRDPDAFAKGRRDGQIPLTGGAEVEDERKQFSFSLAPNGDEGTKKIILTCADGKEKQEWVSTLCKLLAEKEARENMESVKEGYLRVKATLGWNKRYFILLPGVLQYFARRSDPQPVAEIFFDAQSTVAQEDDEGEFAVEGKSKRLLVQAPSVSARREWMDAISAVCRSALCPCFTSISRWISEKKSSSAHTTALFGGRLKDGIKRALYSDGIPTPVVVTIEYIKSQGTAFRIFMNLGADNQGTLQLIHDLERATLDTKLRVPSVRAAAAGLLSYLLQLADPVVPVSSYRSFVSLVSLDRQPSAKDFAEIKALVDILPNDNRTLLNYLLHFLTCIVNTSPDAVALFAPAILRATKDKAKANLVLATVLNSRSSMGRNPTCDSPVTYLATAMVVAYPFLFPDGPPKPVWRLSEEELTEARARPPLSFDAMIASPYCLSLYRRFAAEEFTDENIRFYTHVQSYSEAGYRLRTRMENKAVATPSKDSKASLAPVVVTFNKAPPSPVTPYTGPPVPQSSLKESHRQLLKEALFIVDTFISPGGDAQLNIQGSLRKTYLDRFKLLRKSCPVGSLTGDEFIELAKVAKQLMIPNSYARFLRSRDYDLWLTKTIRSSQN